MNIASNFGLQSKLPNFERDQFDTLDSLKAFPETSLDEGHISYCLETNKHYVFRSGNTPDPVLGKWEALSLGHVGMEITPLEEVIQLPTTKQNKTLFYVQATKKLYDWSNGTGSYIPVTGVEPSDKILLRHDKESLVFDLVDNHGGEMIGIRRIQLLKDNHILELTPGVDYEATATSLYSADYKATDIFKHGGVVTGVGLVGNAWIAGSGITTNQRVVFKPLKDIDFDKIRIDNYHTEGTNVSSGVKNANIYLVKEKTPSGTFNTVTEAYTAIFSGVFPRHAETDTEQLGRITLSVPEEITDGKVFATFKPVNNPVGSFKEGDTVSPSENITLLEAINKLLYKYIPPSGKLTLSPDITLYETGTTANEITVTGTSIKGSDNITSASITVNGTEEATNGTGDVLEYKLSPSGKTSLIFAVSDGVNTITKEKEILFTNKSYYGFIASDTVLDVNGVKGLQFSRLSLEKELEFSDFSMVNSKVVYAYPKTVGELKGIKDQHGFNLLDSFTRMEMDVIEGDPYYVYIQNDAATINHFTIKFI